MTTRHEPNRRPWHRWVLWIDFPAQGNHPAMSRLVAYTITRRGARWNASSREAFLPTSVALLAALAGVRHEWRIERLNPAGTGRTREVGA